MNKTEDKQNKPISHLPSFLIEVQESGEVMIRASWPKPDSPEEFSKTVKAFTGLLMLLSEGKLIPVFQHAVSVYGENHDDVHTAKAILLTIYSMIRQQAPNKGRPLVMPTEAFKKG